MLTFSQHRHIITIRSRREELGLSQEELGNKLGYKSRSSINKIELDQRNLTQSKIKAIADALNTTPAYIMGWEPEDQPPIPASPNIIPMPEMRKVPLLGTIACGAPVFAEEHMDGEVDIPSYIHADFALRCEGDSMINARIFNGDIAYIRRQDTVENGAIAAVLIENEATLKRVRLFDDHISLEPENPMYKPFVYWNEDMNSVRILGKAVAFTSAIR